MLGAGVWIQVDKDKAVDILSSLPKSDVDLSDTIDLADFVSNVSIGIIVMYKNHRCDTQIFIVKRLSIKINIIKFKAEIL